MVSPFDLVKRGTAEGAAVGEMTAFEDAAVAEEVPTFESAHFSLLFPSKVGKAYSTVSAPLHAL